MDAAGIAGASALPGSLRDGLARTIDVTSI